MVRQLAEAAGLQAGRVHARLCPSLNANVAFMLWACSGGNPQPYHYAWLYWAHVGFMRAYPPAIKNPPAPFNAGG